MPARADISVTDADRAKRKRAGFPLLALIFIAFATIAADAAEPRRVLLLHAFGHAYSPWSDIAGSFRAELIRKSSDPIDLFEVSLDAARVHDPAKEWPFVEYIRALLSGRRLDLIVPIGAPAAFFVQRHRSSLFPESPMLITGADIRRIPSHTLTKNDAGVLLDSHLPDTLENILRLRPDTTEVAIVVGNSPVERYWASELRRDLARFEDRVRITWFNDLTFAEMLERAATMPPQSAILWCLLTEDAAGVPHPQDRALETMREVAIAPLFGVGDYQLGRGIVGGPLLQTRALGAEAATAALRILSGESPNNIGLRTVELSAPTYDWRELRRWGISEDRLPPESVIRFREPTLWETHRAVILAALFVIGLQSILVAFLLIQRRRRKKAEDMLRRSEERMAFTAASMNIGLWQFNRVTNELWATEHCRALFGLAPDVPLSRDAIMNAIHPEDRDMTMASLRRAADSGGPTLSDFRVILADGQVRWIRARARARQIGQRHPGQLSGLFAEVTDQKLAESEAELHRREIAHLTRVSALGELSGAIAHEINQPLTAILSNAQAALHFLSKSSPNLDEVRAALTDIVEEDSRAGEVIRRLRRLLKKDEEKTEPLHVNDLVQSTLTLLHSELIGRRVAVEITLADWLPPVTGDQIQLQQVLLNLIINAMDAMAATPVNRRQVAIATQHAGDGVEIVVRDTGPGLPAGTESKAFEPFYTTKNHGLGLGLAICSSIVNAHDGTLTLKNHETGGVAAVVRLPAQQFAVAAQ